MIAGDVLIADLDPVRGHEQGGRRPVVVVSAERYSIPRMFLGVPLTTTERRIRHHIVVPADSSTGLDEACFALPEQIRALSPERVKRHLGRVDEYVLRLIGGYVHSFIA